MLKNIEGISNLAGSVCEIKLFRMKQMLLLIVIFQLTYIYFVLYIYFKEVNYNKIRLKQFINV